MHLRLSAQEVLLDTFLEQGLTEPEIEDEGYLERDTDTLITMLRF